MRDARRLGSATGVSRRSLRYFTLFEMPLHMRGRVLLNRAQLNQFLQ